VLNISTTITGMSMQAQEQMKLDPHAHVAKIVQRMNESPPVGFREVVRHRSIHTVPYFPGGTAKDFHRAKEDSSPHGRLPQNVGRE
jgi:hypothetical protein